MSLLRSWMPVRSSSLAHQKVWVRCFAKGSIMSIFMPALSPTMEKGNIVNWKKAVGEQINPGDVIGEIETDKATIDFVSQEAGYMAALYVPAGSNDVPVGQILGLMVEEKEDLAEAQARPAPSVAPSPAPAAAQETANKAQPAPAPVAPQGGLDTLSMEASTGGPFDYHTARVSPSARHILQSAGIDPRSVMGTGKRGLVLKPDALKAVQSHGQIRAQAEQLGQKLMGSAAAAPASQAAAAAPSAAAASAVSATVKPYESEEFADIKVTNIRKVIAERLLQSKREHPHAYMSVNVNMTKTNALRESMKKAGVVFSVNDVFIAAIARAIAKSRTAFQLKDNEDVDISIAVATEKGLLTPVVKAADKKGLADIASSVKDLAARGRSGKLAPSEMSGGHFSVSNLGMFGIDSFAAVINPPQLGILAVSRANNAILADTITFPLVEDASPASSSNAESSSSLTHPVDLSSLKDRVAPVMIVQMSLDGSRFSEDAAVELLQRFKRTVEEPQWLLA